MPRFSVDTTQLPAAAVRVASTGRELSAAQAAMTRVQGVASGVDAPKLTSALSALAQAVAATAGSVGVATDALAATTHGAGAAYDATERSAIAGTGDPFAPPGGGRP